MIPEVAEAAAPEPELQRRARRRLVRHGLRLEGEALAQAAQGLELVEGWRAVIERHLRAAAGSKARPDG